MSKTDAFFYSSPLDAILLKCIFLRDSNPNDSGKNTVASGSSLYEDVQAGAFKFDLEEANEVTAWGVLVDRNSIFFGKSRTKHTQTRTKHTTIK